MPFVERCSDEIPFLCYLFSTWWSSVLLVRHHQLLKLRVGVHIPCGERMVLTELLGSFFFLLFAKGLTFKVSEQVLLHLTLWKLIYNAIWRQCKLFPIKQNEEEGALGDRENPAYWVCYIPLSCQLSLTSKPAEMRFCSQHQYGPISGLHSISF